MIEASAAHWAAVLRLKFRPNISLETQITAEKVEADRRRWWSCHSRSPARCELARLSATHPLSIAEQPVTGILLGSRSLIDCGRFRKNEPVRCPLLAWSAMVASKTCPAACPMAPSRRERLLVMAA